MGLLSSAAKILHALVKAHGRVQQDGRSVPVGEML